MPQNNDENNKHSGETPADAKSGKRKPAAKKPSSTKTTASKDSGAKRKAATKTAATEKPAPVRTGGAAGKSAAKKSRSAAGTTAKKSASGGKSPASRGTAAKKGTAKKAPASAKEKAATKTSPTEKPVKAKTTPKSAADKASSTARKKAAYRTALTEKPAPVEDAVQATASSGGTASEYYVVRTIQRVADNLQTPLADANEKYLRRAVESGRDFVEDVGKGTRETLSGVVDEGRRFAARIPALESLANAGEPSPPEATAIPEKDGSRDTLVDILMDSFGQNLREFHEEHVRKVVETTMFLVGDVGMTALTKFGTLVQEGRRVLARSLFLEAIEDIIEDRLRNAAGLLNLPTKEEVDRLTRAMDKFNKKADQLRFEEK
ncbi:MAG: hypothetical protein ACLFOY_02035 [Desulfatibacillaceae bacterium]